jgi:hypothetical protein
MEETMKVAMLVDGKMEAWVPVYLQKDMLNALEYLKEHPEEVEGKGPAETVSWVLANVYIRWEDIPGPRRDQGSSELTVGGFSGRATTILAVGRHQDFRSGPAED